MHTSTQTLNQQAYAQLQQCGIDVYEAVNTIDVARAPWLKKVCELLNIEPSACDFDYQHVFFDSENKILHLPSIFYGTENDLKKAVWRNIQQHV